MDIEGIPAEHVPERKIPIFGIASADGFDQAWPGRHPRELMPRCRSVVVFGRPFIRHPLLVDEESHIANESWWKVNDSVVRETAKWRGEIIDLFDACGLGTANFGGYGPTSEPTFSYTPCEGCTVCAEVCPVRAIDTAKAPAKGYNRELCIKLILKKKKRHGDDEKICSRCFSACPWGAESKARHRRKKC